MPTAEEILQNSLRGIDLPTATSALSTEYFFFWSNTNNRLEKLLKSNINTNPYFSYDFFGLVTSAGTTTTNTEVETAINTQGFTIAAGEVKFLKCNVLIDSIVYVRVYQYLPNAAGSYGTTAGNEIAFANLFELEERVLSQTSETTTTLALGDIGASTIEDYINANDDTDWDLQAKVIYIFTATISSVDYQYLYVGVQPQYIGVSYNAVTSDDFLELSGANITGVNIEGTDILSTGEVGGSKFLRENGDGTSSWQSIPGGGDLLAANNGSDFDDIPTVRTNLGLNTTANQTDSADKRFVTDAQEAKIDYLTVTQAVDLDQMETDIAALANGMVYKDDWDASSGSFPGGGSAEIGWFYNVSVAGTVDSVEFAIGDSIIAKVDNASTTTYAANWVKKDQTDAVQSVAGLVGTISASGLRTALNVEDGADVTDATNVDAAGATMNTDFNANTILAATTDDTPAAITVAEQTLVGRITSGNITALTVTQIRTLLAYLEELIDGTADEALTVTGATNVDLSAAAHRNIKLTGNATLTFTNTPAVGKTITRTYKVYSAATETLGIANSTAEYGAYVADTTETLMTVMASNTSTEGLDIHVFFSQPD